MPLPSPQQVGACLADGWRDLVPPSWLEGWRPIPFELGDGSTEVVVMGSGPTLLVLPPSPGYKEAMVRVVARLAQRFRVVTCDLRVRFDGRPSWDQWLADLERVTHAYAPGRTIVLGHSLGGALAQQWALRHPERVEALVLSSTFACLRTSPRPGLAGALRDAHDSLMHQPRRYIEQPLALASQRWLPRGAALAIAGRLAARHGWVYDPACDLAVLDLVRHSIRHQSFAEARAVLSLAFAHDTRATLRAAVRATPLRALSVVGQFESRWARDVAAELAALLAAGARTPAAGEQPPALIELPGVNHLHPLSAPELLSDAVLDWLEPRASC